MNKRDPFMDKFNLLNPSERLLYKKLCAAAPSFIVFAQVSMSQIFYIGNFQKDRIAQLNEIGKKSVDFLLCKKDTSIVMAVELHGPDHEKEEQQASDKIKKAALEEAGIPLEIFKLSDLSDSNKLTKRLAPYVVERHKIEETRTCEDCDKRVQHKVVEYCQLNKIKFAGKVLCRKCQPLYGTQ